jgi:hypothetical protein
MITTLCLIIVFWDVAGAMHPSNTIAVGIQFYNSIVVKPVGFEVTPIKV